MVGDHVMAAQASGVPGAQSNTTRGPHTTVCQGAIDVVGRGARLHSDMFTRRVLIEVCTVHTYIMHT
jgi:hypothetical protein